LDKKETPIEGKGTGDEKNPKKVDAPKARKTPSVNSRLVKGGGPGEGEKSKIREGGSEPRKGGAGTASGRGNGRVTGGGGR